MLDGGSFLDVDDEVADVLDDKEVVRLALLFVKLLLVTIHTGFC